MVYSRHSLFSVLTDQGPDPEGGERKGPGYPGEEEVWGEVKGEEHRRVRDTAVGGRIGEARRSEREKRE